MEGKEFSTVLVLFPDIRVVSSVRENRHTQQSFMQQLLILTGKFNYQ